jgi:hypothetical protein
MCSGCSDNAYPAANDNSPAEELPPPASNDQELDRGSTPPRACRAPSSIREPHRVLGKRRAANEGGLPSHDAVSISLV